MNAPVSLYDDPKLRLAYLAGVVDADGCLTIIRHGIGGFTPRVQCGQVQSQAVGLLCETLGGHISTSHPPSHANLQPQHKWQANNVIAGIAARRLAPYLVLKRRQAELVVECAALNRWRFEGKPRRPVEALEALCAEIRRLNQIGRR